MNIGLTNIEMDRNRMHLTGLIGSHSNFMSKSPTQPIFPIVSFIDLIDSSSPLGVDGLFQDDENLRVWHGKNNFNILQNTVQDINMQRGLPKVLEEAKMDGRCQVGITKSCR